MGSRLAAVGFAILLLAEREAGESILPPTAERAGARPFQKTTDAVVAWQQVTPSVNHTLQKCRPGTVGQYIENRQTECCKSAENELGLSGKSTRENQSMHGDSHRPHAVLSPCRAALEWVLHRKLDP